MIAAAAMNCLSDPAGGIRVKATNCSLPCRFLTPPSPPCTIFRAPPRVDLWPACVRLPCNIGCVVASGWCWCVLHWARWRIAATCMRRPNPFPPHTSNAICVWVSATPCRRRPRNWHCPSPWQWMPSLLISRQWRGRADSLDWHRRVRHHIPANQALNRKAIAFVIPHP